MDDKVEEIRKRHIRKFRRFQWVTGVEAIVFSIVSLFWSHPAWIVLTCTLGICCLAEEYLIEKVKAMPAQNLMELERLSKKIGL